MTSEAIEKNDVAGYVCPSCRMVFSTFSELKGNGVQCPGCGGVLRIPSIDDRVNEINVVAYEAEVEKPDQSVKKRRSKNSSYKPDSQEGSVNPSGDYSLKLIIPLLAFSLLAMGGIAYIFLSPASKSSVVANENTTIENLVDKDLHTPSVSSESEEQNIVELKEEVFVYDSSNEVHVERLEKFLTAWFSVASIDDRLNLVRPSEQMEKKMARFYTKNPPVETKFKSLERATNLVNHQGYVAFVCQTEDYKRHAGIIKFTEDKIFLDWESYVAYSEMTMAELAETKPTEPVKVRMKLQSANYYNNYFIDERKWRAVILENPNEEDVIYGYVEINSATEHRVFNFGNTDTQLLTLEISYPPNAESGNQVIINKVLEQSWLENLDR